MSKYHSPLTLTNLPQPAYIISTVYDVRKNLLKMGGRFMPYLLFTKDKSSAGMIPLSNTFTPIDVPRMLRYIPIKPMHCIFSTRRFRLPVNFFGQSDAEIFPEMMKLLTSLLSSGMARDLNKKGITVHNQVLYHKEQPLELLFLQYPADNYSNIHIVVFSTIGDDLIGTPFRGLK